VHVIQVLARKEAVAKLGLREMFENSLVHYLLPTHPLFISVYAIYAIMAINLAYVIRHSENGRFRKIIVGSFTDLKNLSWVCLVYYRTVCVLQTFYGPFYICQWHVTVSSRWSAVRFVTHFNSDFTFRGRERFVC